ncbi:unnamed protein product, partial [Symbiodinium sp. CCMP2456]
KRQALRGKPGLSLLFRWEAAFVFNVKGILSDIAADVIGPIHLVDGSLDSGEARYLGELLTVEDARTTKPDKDGFDARLDWVETGWQESEGILDADSMCTVQVLLRRVGETLEYARKRGSTVRLRVKPTRLAYAASEPGLRLGLSSPSSVQDRLATVVSFSDSGEVLVKVDGGEEEMLDPRPSTVVVASTVERDAKSCCSTTKSISSRQKCLATWEGVRYTTAGASEEHEVDLNEMNHSLQRFASLQDYEATRIEYCKKVVEDGRYIEDAITGNRVDISEQIVRVQMEVRQHQDADSIRHMAFDDLEWISDTVFHLGDRVWAQGREGIVEHLQKHGRYVVKYSDGTSSPALPSSSIKRGRPISGVQNSSFEKASLQAWLRDMDSWWKGKVSMIGMAIGFMLVAALTYSYVAFWIDGLIAPDETKLWNSDSYEDRLRNTSHLPADCMRFLQTDVVEEVDSCLQWCRHSLGPGSCIAYAFSYDHVIKTATHRNASVRIIYGTCLKVEVAAFARRIIPSQGLVYLWALAYIILCLVLLGSGGVFDRWPGCDEARAVVLLARPALDLVVFLTFLRSGQPYYAVFMCAGLLMSYMLLSKGTSGFTPLFTKGVIDGLKEVRDNGKESKKLKKIKAAETFECFMGTTVQIYSILRMPPEYARLMKVLPLTVIVSWKLFHTLPDCAWAIYSLAKLDSNGTIQRKVQGRVQRLVHSFLSLLCCCVALATWFVIAYARQDVSGVRYVACCWQLVDRLLAAHTTAWMNEQWSQAVALLLLMPFRAAAFLSLLAWPIITIMWASVFVAEACWNTADRSADKARRIYSYRSEDGSDADDSSNTDVRDISEMVPLLLHKSRVVQGRSHGAHSCQPVLIRAGPGTGKTWSMQQLLLLLAQELAGGGQKEDFVKFRFVPLLIPIQKLARMLRQRSASDEEASSNLVLFFIRTEYPQGPTRNMLEQAFEMRSLIVMLDGIDEAANMKLAVEEFVTKTLVLMGVPLLVTSRPEGIRKRLYSRSFIIMNLQPLSGDQQHKIIEKQLQQNSFFKHLVSFSRARQALEEAFQSNFPESSADRRALEALPQMVEEAVAPATAVIDHELFAAVFFCAAVRLLASAGLNPACLQLPLDPQDAEKDPAETRDVQKRLSIHSKKLGMIKADFVCPSAASLASLCKTLLTGFTVQIDGEPASLHVARRWSSFQDPGPTRLRFLRYELRLKFQDASHTAQVQIHHSECLSAYRTSQMQEHYTHLQKSLKNQGGLETFDAMLEARMSVFDAICRIPVLLSVLACAFAVETQRLPQNLYDLYEMGMLSTLERRVGKDRVQAVLEMLQAIAVANHIAKRRTFQAEDLRAALKEPSQLALWSQLLEDGSVPLVKILTLGDMTGEFQFSHLSFQEALFVRALSASDRGKQFRCFWGSDTSLNSSLNDPFYRNTFVIGRGYLGEALASSQPSFNFDCQPRLSGLGREGLRHLLAGTRSLRSLQLGNVDLGGQIWADLVNSMLPGLSLQELVLSRCQLSAVKPLGALLRACPKLRLLDLEGNKNILKIPSEVGELQETVGECKLDHLEVLSLRWCHISISSGTCIKGFLTANCPALTRIDLQGNRGLSRSLFADTSLAAYIQGC